MTTARNTVLFGAALAAATAAIAVDHANHPVPRAQPLVAGEAVTASAPCAAGAPATAPCAAGAPLAAAPPPPAQAPCAAGAPCAAAPAPTALRAPPPPPAQAPAAPQLAAPPPPPAALPDPEGEAPDLVVDG